MYLETPTQEVGESIPGNTPHAVSVSLPTLKAVVGYEEGQDWVVKLMKCGYPRFFIHEKIRELAKQIEDKYGREGEKCMIFSSYNAAKRCREFMKEQSDSTPSIRILQLNTAAPVDETETSSVVQCKVGVVFFSEEAFPVAKTYWQHTGEGISSRMGEYCLRELFDPVHSSSSRKRSHLKLEIQAQKIQQKSPSLSKLLRSGSLSGNEEVEKEFNTFIEQKFGRVLDLKFADRAKIALRRRICGKVDKSKNQEDEMEKARRGKYLNETDVYLYQTGMTAIFHSHQALLNIFPEPKKSVCFGFPYVDTLNILKKFGPGVHFLGFGDDKSLDEMEEGLENGSIDIMALVCECPSNPLLKTPNLKRIRSLADKYNFAVIVDETVGNFLNIHVLPYADMVVSSLTKVFSGDSNVMGGSLVLNPLSKLYGSLKSYFETEYEDNVWAEDALYLERNSRDFVERSSKINENSLEVIEVLQQSPLISNIYYPSLSESKKHYDEIKRPNGGYGGLISFTFKDAKDAESFYDNCLIYKGPSLGTNFTLACPYAIIAHYKELDEVQGWGVDKHIIRVSIGLEDKPQLIDIFRKALEAAEANHQ